jgi:hypothetical protein
MERDAQSMRRLFVEESQQRGAVRRIERPATLRVAGRLLTEAKKSRRVGLAPSPVICQLLPSEVAYSTEFDRMVSRYHSKLSLRSRSPVGKSTQMMPKRRE